MKIFLTGGTGFIGSNFINQAFNAGDEIVALRRTTNSRPRVALAGEPAWITGSMEHVTVDDMEGCDALVHLAACGVSPQIASWPELIKGNIHDPQKLFQTATEAGIGRWVVAGTFAEYGRSGERYEFIPEDAPLEPTFPYAASKAAFFQIVHSMAVQQKSSLAYLRVFSAFGEGQHPDNLWPSLKNNALAGKDFPSTPGDQIRDFIEVEKVASIFLAAAKRTDLKEGEPWVRNLASGEPLTVAEFCERWWARFEASGRFMKGALPYRPNEVMRYVPTVDPSIFQVTP